MPPKIIVNAPIHGIDWYAPDLSVAERNRLVYAIIKATGANCLWKAVAPEGDLNIGPLFRLALHKEFWSPQLSFVKGFLYGLEVEQCKTSSNI